MIQQKVAQWKEKMKDAELCTELAALEGDNTALTDRFYKDLEFGTGGLRGILGVGTNCMNIYTVAKATEGVALYMVRKEMRSVAVSYDSRIHSETFARLAACIFAERGIKAVIVKELMPTPFLSYMTRKCGCDMGIMITASHNPAKYNGYKVYNSEGCQITDNAAKEISACIAEIPYFAAEYKTFSQYLESGKIEMCGDEVEEAYLEYVRGGITQPIDALKITYTALNGTGYRIIPKLLRSLGIGELKTVAEQTVPDGKFPTCPYPNPEKAEALSLGLQQAAENNSDLLLGSDPDADRVGVAVRDNGEYKLLTGNETGILLCNYLLSKRKESGTLPAQPVIVKTIVTTDLAFPIAEGYGGKVIEVLTGFKYIGEQIGLLEKAGREGDFVLGFEESYGYLAGTQVRDKDAVQACALVCEMAAYYKAKGKTLCDVLGELYQKYGRYYHSLYSYEFEGAKGSETMQRLMKRLRDSGGTVLDGVQIESVKDYLHGIDGLPASNVLSYRLKDGNSFIVRPSGTEPKIKVYVTTKDDASAAERIKSALEKYFYER